MPVLLRTTENFDEFIQVYISKQVPNASQGYGADLAEIVAATLGVETAIETGYKSIEIVTDSQYFDFNTP